MISLIDLSFAYQKELPLFDGVNTQFDQSGICALLGKNGAGKSTLLNIIAGLLFPQYGTCVTLGRDSTLRHPQVLSNLYYLAEEFYLPPITIKKFHNHYSCFYPNFDHEKFKHFIKILELKESDALHKLSYGQKKKCLISFGLATQSKILLLDEPTNGLDIPSKAQIQKFIAAEANDERFFLISTHLVNDIKNLTDSVAIIDNGKIIVNSPLEKIAQKIQCNFEISEPDHHDCLYYEKQLGGYATLNTQISGDETAVNLELLFNAAINSPNTLQTKLNEA